MLTFYKVDFPPCLHSLSLKMFNRVLKTHFHLLAATHTRDCLLVLSVWLTHSFSSYYKYLAVSEETAWGLIKHKDYYAVPKCAVWSWLLVWPEVYVAERSLLQSHYMSTFLFFSATDLLLAWNPVCLGLVEGVIGKIQLHTGKWRVTMLSGQYFPSMYTHIIRSLCVS